MHRRLLLACSAAGALGLLAGLAPFDAPGSPGTAGAAASITFTETFSGAPSSPTAWDGANWDVTVHSRDIDTWPSLEPMMAYHGADCAGPPNMHQTSAYDLAAFNCKDHMMTALKAGGYGVAYLTPNHMVDFSQGEAVIKFDISTLRTSDRDWWDVWISPFGTALQLPLDPTLPDLSGRPADSVNVRLTGANTLEAQITDNFQAVQFPDWPNDKVTGNWWQGYETFLTPDPARRDTVEIRISRTHLKVGMPTYNFWWIDSDIPALDWSQGLVQFGHHSYNPEKDCGTANDPGPDGTCRANTWHWDNVSISPATPFTIIKADQRVADASDTTVNLSAPAPAGSYLRFAGIGDTMQVRFNGGAWQNASLANQELVTTDERFASFWTPVPAGTTTVEFRGTNWWAAQWMARDISVFSKTLLSGGTPPTTEAPTTTQAPTTTAPATTAPATTAPATTAPATTQAPPTTAPATTAPATTAPATTAPPTTTQAPTTTTAPAPQPTLAPPTRVKSWSPRKGRLTVAWRRPTGTTVSLWIDGQLYRSGITGTAITITGLPSGRTVSVTLTLHRGGEFSAPTAPIAVRIR